MDTHPHMNGVTTLERVQTREEFRSLLTDVGKLPETQRSALLLREIDAMSYEEIAQAMDTTVPGVKSLLVRARIALAESSQARQLTCDEVRLELAEAAEGLAKVTGPARRHIKGCDACGEFRSQLRADSKALAAIFPAGPLLIAKGALLAKLSGLFGGGSGGAAAGGGGGVAAGAAGAGTAGAGAAGVAGAGAAGAGAGVAGVGAAGGAGAAATSAAVGGAAAAGGAAAGGGAAAAAGGAAAAIGTKAAAGLATAAIIAGGAVEVQKTVTDHPKPQTKARQHQKAPAAKPQPAAQTPVLPGQASPPAAPAAGTPAPATGTPPPPTVTVPPTDPTAAGGTAATAGAATVAGKHKHHKPIANSDSKATESPQTGPVTTGVEPAVNCDTDGDGVTDPGAPSSCTTGTSVDTAVVQGDVTPAAPTATTAYAAPAHKKKHRAALKKKR
jgi:hypothetical protein